MAALLAGCGGRSVKGGAGGSEVGSPTFGPQPSETVYGPNVEAQPTAASTDTTAPPAAGSELVGPPPPEAPPAPTTEQPPPAPSPAQPAKFCVVLGPGMARAFAHVGVIQALQKEKIPVGCVVGVEMGALMGALFALDGKANSLLWQSPKFARKEFLFDFPLLSLRTSKSSLSRFHKHLADIVSTREITSLKIPFATTAVSKENDQAVVFRRERVADAVAASVALADLYDSWPVEGREYVSGAALSPLPVEIARAMGGTTVLVVNVIDDSVVNTNERSTSGRLQNFYSGLRAGIQTVRKQADLFLEPQVRGFAFDDVAQLNELRDRGREETQRMMPKIRAAWEKDQADRAPHSEGSH